MEDLILWFSNSTYGQYGYAIVSKYVVKGLRDHGFKVVCIGLQTLGRVIKDEYGNSNLPIAFDIWGSDAVEPYLKAFQPDILVSMLDIWVKPLHYLPDTVRKYPAKWLHHATISYAPISPILIDLFSKADHLVAPSWFVFNELSAVPVPRTYIPHGVNLKIYKKNKKARKELRGELGYEDKFVFLTIGRNRMHQKGFASLFHAFRTLLVNKPELKDHVVLHCHAYPYEPDGINLVMGRDRMGLKDYVKVTCVKPSESLDRFEICNENNERAILYQPNCGLLEEEMARLYNMADCFVLATRGESFCLPIIEAQACGLTCVMTGCSTAHELISEPKTGLVAKVIADQVNPLISSESIVDPTDLACKMYEIYENSELRRKFSRSAIRNAKNYSWDKVVPKWAELMENLLVEDVSYEKGTLGL